MINFKHEKYELLFSNKLPPFWALQYADKDFFNAFQRLCRGKYRILSVIESGWQNKYGNLADLEVLSRLFKTKATEVNWEDRLRRIYKKQSSDLNKYLKGLPKKNNELDDKQLINSLLELRTISAPLDAMSNMLHMFSYLVESGSEEKKSNKIILFGTHVKDEVSKLLQVRKKSLAGFFKELGRRLGCASSDLEYLSLSEINSLLKRSGLQKLVKQRRARTVFFWNKNAFEVYEGKQAQVFLKKGKFEQILEAINVNIIKGQPASPGKATGRVIVAPNSDIANSKIKKGEILVAPYTAVEYLPAMKKAAAIITDTGGLTAHAAIVSRELGIPCIIGTKNASRILKDGDLVEVDADKGIVRKIK